MQNLKFENLAIRFTTLSRSGLEELAGPSGHSGNDRNPRFVLRNRVGGLVVNETD